MKNRNGRRYNSPKININMLVIAVLIGMIIFLLYKDKPENRSDSEPTIEIETPAPTILVPSKNPEPPMPSADIEPVLNGFYLGFDLTAYQYSGENWGWVPYETRHSIMMGGVRYYRALVFQAQSRSPFSGTSSASFNLDGKYSKLTARYGHVDGSADFSETISIYADGDCVLEIEAKPTDFGVYFELDLTGVNVLRIDVPFSPYSQDTFYSIVEAELIP